MKLILSLFFLYGVRCQTFKDNGYENLVVAIHPDVSSDQQQTIVDNLKVSWQCENKYNTLVLVMHFTKKMSINC